MALELLGQSEVTPAAWPLTPSRYSFLAHIAPMLWQRIESYVAYRFSPRSVTWIVSGDEDWQPNLAPATISATEVWQNSAWTPVTLDPSPLGGYVLEGSIYRFTATVGSGYEVEIPDPDPDALPGATITAHRAPEAVEAAFGRLGEYLEANAETATPIPVTARQVGETRLEWPEWRPGRAMQLSGAADLLRSYRRA